MNTKSVHIFTNPSQLEQEGDFLPYVDFEVSVKQGLEIVV